MFSYRHAFHAGNHADVLKHTVLIAVLRYMTAKEAALNVIDTHAGAGLYRLDGDYAHKSGESAEGIQRLVSQAAAQKTKLAPVLADYLETIQSFNSGPNIKVYPGSPFIVQKLIGDRDRLKAFELHPNDSRALSGNLAQLEAGRQVAVLVEDGFEGIKKFLPPPSRRALVLCDPSYELKTDYGRVQDMVAEGLRRLANGTFAVWYPIIPRTEAHDLPKRLKTMATKLGKPWLHATLSVKGGKIGEGLAASGMFLINPPYTLKDQLKLALPQMVALLGQDVHAAFTLESGS
jgi:23S rRNA (adenine2030-N6)-methyltransferase